MVPELPALVKKIPSDQLVTRNILPVERFTLSTLTEISDSVVRCEGS